MARPKNTEKSTPQAQRELARNICAESLSQLKKKLKQASVGELTALVTKLLPIVLDEDTQSTSDITLELLTQKACKVQMRIENANKKNLQSEQIQEEN